MELPKLRRINNTANNKKKILLLSDDLRMHSGVATMSKELVYGTAHHYNWSQVGAAINHPDHGKIFDISNNVNSEMNITDANVKVLAHTGYGNANLIRELIQIEKPSAIMIFTDPRFWDWLFDIEFEIRQQIPLIYYNIWDATPAPFWNLSSYESCDCIMNISKQTNALVQSVLDYGNVSYNVLE